MCIHIPKGSIDFLDIRLFDGFVNRLDLDQNVHILKIDFMCPERASRRRSDVWRRQDRTV
jgi:hypothetical protein